MESIGIVPERLVQKDFALFCIYFRGFSKVNLDREPTVPRNIQNLREQDKKRVRNFCSVGYNSPVTLILNERLGSRNRRSASTDLHRRSFLSTWPPDITLSLSANRCAAPVARIIKEVLHRFPRESQNYSTHADLRWKISYFIPI